MCRENLRSQNIWAEGDRESVEESDHIFNIWLLTAYKHLPPFSSAPHLGKLVGKHRCPSLGTAGKSKPCKTPFENPPTWYHPLTTINHKANCTSLLSQAIFGSVWDPALLSPESLIMWIINLFIVSGVFVVLSLSISELNFGQRSILFLWDDFNGEREWERAIFWLHFCHSRT